MSQSRFSIVLVGVSALLRRPLVSRLRPADGERSPWVVFAARVGRFESGFRWAGWPSGSLLPLFGMHRFGDCPRRVGLWAHCFRFSACPASEIALGGLAFGFTASAFRHAPLRSGHWASSFFRLPFRRFRSAGWSSGSLLPLFGMHRFGVALGGLAFGLTASDFRHAPIRSGRWAVGLRAYCFGDCHLAGWPLGSPLRKFRSAGWPSGSLLPLFGMRRFGVAAGRVRSSAFRFGVAARRVGLRASASAFRHAPLRSCPRRAASSAFRFGDSVRRVGSSARRLAFGLTASAFRHAPLRSGRWASSFFRLPLRRFRSAGWPSDSRLPLFGTRRFGVAAGRVGLRAHRFRFSACADPHRCTAEARTDGAQRHDTCFTSKHLSQHVNLPHRTP